MNWEAISAISEIVGAVAVVLSLIYLAIQIRSSTRATRATVHLGLHESDAHWGALFISDPSLAELFDRGCAGDSKLSTADQRRFSRLILMLFNEYELFFFLNRECIRRCVIELSPSRPSTLRPQAFTVPVEVIARL